MDNLQVLFPHLPEILNNPDEVWLHAHNNREKSFQVRYLKFYKYRVMVIDTGIEGDTLEITTWYNLKAEEDYLRKGLLIKKRKA